MKEFPLVLTTGSDIVSENISSLAIIFVQPVNLPLIFQLMHNCK